ncbi:hypothetical protein LOC68_19795 [Blastopirellula sp. JC732]|uniref:Virginiamycin B lyase n=1 Tax=Blastopirellula sediminis TaxID=2894196 RepID=A0A9X1SLF4_9BACT|nr:hypothetical protein [Blastopirellula sediminis]MCC9606057.1 hypothetical protein [Blastopirellula sediminis]MCC9630644.1 hypothetical protein [Blastopirellula sediminis]
MSRIVGTLVCFTLIAVAGYPAIADERRSEQHAKFAADFWNYLDGKFDKWEAIGELPSSVPAPHVSGESKTYANPAALKNLKDPGYGSIFVVEHLQDGKSIGLTACFRAKAGIDVKQNDWYWLYYLPAGEAVKTSADKAAFDKPGFVTFEDDGRLWVFNLNNPNLADFLSVGELTKQVIRPGVGPSAMTLKSDEMETILGYLAAKPGFVTAIEDGRVWVLKEGSDAAKEFLASGEPAKQVIRPGVGPLGTTLKSDDAATIAAYRYAKPGFQAAVDGDGRVWVFPADSDAWKEYVASGEPAAHVTKIGVGPNRETLKTRDAGVIEAYLVAQPGYVTKIIDGRLWVVRVDSADLKEFAASHDLAKHVTKIGAGPLGMTIKSPDSETIDSYMRNFR